MHDHSDAFHNHVRIKFINTVVLLSKEVTFVCMVEHFSLYRSAGDDIFHM